MQDSDLLRVPWNCVDESPGCRKSYQWMVAQMELRGIDCAGFAPIWAWRACAPEGGGPTDETMRSLLSDHQLQGGVTLVEFEVPDALVLVSSYMRWNQLLDYAMQEGGVMPTRFTDMFGDQRTTGDDLQECVPYMKREWIRGVREVRA